MILTEFANCMRTQPDGFADAHEVPSALNQWILAGKPRESLRLLASNVADLYDSGREATIERTLAQIPLSVATEDLQSMIEFAWCHLLVDKKGFLNTVRQATVWRDRLDESPQPQVGRLGILQSIAATINGDWVCGDRLAKEAMATLGDSVASDPLGRFGWNMVARELALSETWDEDSLTLEGVRLELNRDPERRLAFEGTRALGESLAGRPVDALRIAAGVKDVADVHSMTILRAELDIARAMAHRELGDRARAAIELEALSSGGVGPVSHAQALAMLELTQLRLDEGDIVAAGEMLSRAREFVRKDFSGVGGTSWLARTATLVALASRRVEDARTWTEEIRDPFWGGVSSARIDLFEGNFEAAAQTLDRAVPRCIRHRVVRDLLRARAADCPDQAREFVTLAIEGASDVGLVQTVACEGADVLELLEHHAWVAPKDWLDRVRLAASTQAAGSLVDPSLPGEHLTEREMEVLRMLPSRLTLREIAGELFISANTLKFHLRVIYRKLGVGSREDAAAVARRMTSPGRRGSMTVGNR